MRISDWSSYVCSSDLFRPGRRGGGTVVVAAEGFARVAGSAATAPGDAARASADLLGYDTSDFRARAREMAEAALSRRNADVVAAEIARDERRLGLPV